MPETSELPNTSPARPTVICPPIAAHHKRRCQTRRQQDPTECGGMQRKLVRARAREEAFRSLSPVMDCAQAAEDWTSRLGSCHLLAVVDKSNGRAAAVPLTYGCEWHHNLCTKPPLEQRYGRRR